jgi:hypothetical protein
MGGISAGKTGSPSYVVGSAYTLLDLSEEERAHLDRAEWVFCCNSFLSNWRLVGFRPSVWVWGDTDRRDLIDQFRRELETISDDPDLHDRPRLRFAAVETERRSLELACRDHGWEVQFYRRGQPWERGQEPAETLGGQIYHYGSTLTDMVNIAWILNPGQPIKILGNPHGGHLGHFYDPDHRVSYPRINQFWRCVVDAMWTGLGDLHEAGLKIVDCNDSHPKTLPASAQRIPHGHVLD